jgi:hypothetical protein
MDKSDIEFKHINNLKHNNKMKKPFLPASDAGIRAWIRNFADKVGGYAPKYGITATEVADMLDSADAFEQLLNYTDALDACSKNATALKNELRDGVPSGATPSVLVALPVQPATLPDPGFLKRVSSLTNRIKGHVSYTIADGENMGLEGAAVEFDLNTVKPRITEVVSLPDKVIIGWTKGSMQGVIVQRSLDGVTFNDVDKDFKSPWEDMSQNRTSTSEWRYYRLRYLYNDAQVGVYSEPVRVLVSIGGPAAPKP